MEFKQAIQTCLRDKYVDFSGRASRSEYWWFILFNTIIWVVLEILGLACAFSKILAVIFLVVMTVIYLGLLLPSLAVSARRLHDTGKSAWFLLLYLIPLIGTLILLVFFVTPSVPESNAYGESPLPAPQRSE